MNIAAFIDHTVLKATTTVTDVDKLCTEAAEYGFAAVCVPPLYVKQAKHFLRNAAPAVATVIGFPLGYNAVNIKEAEAVQAITDGADELDLVLNIAALKNGDWNFLESEVMAICAHTEKSGALLKVILETALLTDEEIITCCNLYQNFPVHFLKTSTGFAVEGGATVQTVSLLRQHLPQHIGIKASGGVKTYAFAQQLVAAGATRLGCSASVAIVQQQSDEI